MRVSRSTRAWLAGELAAWRAEGLVDERAERELTRRYGLTGDGTSRALFVVYLVASLLIGGGVLSFVAWNWDAMPAAAKLALGGAALVAAYTGGYWLAELDGRRPLLGRALTLLGSLLFGANIGIVAQVFQLGGEFWRAAGLWGAGAALAAWLLRSPASGMLAAALGWIWVVARVDGGDAPWTAPLVMIAVLVPLAFYLRAPLLFGVVVLATGGSLAAAAVQEDEELFLASALATASLLVALDLAFGPRLARFATVARRLGTLASVVLAYALSFHELANVADFAWNAETWLAAILPQLAGVLVCIAVAARAGSLRRRPLVLVVLAANVALFSAGLVPEGDVLVAVVANVALAAFAVEGIRSSMDALERGTFWASLALVLLVIVSRFIEYETGLLTKALVFAACGAAVLGFGLAFERRVNARRARHA